MFSGWLLFITNFNSTVDEYLDCVSHSLCSAFLHSISKPRHPLSLSQVLQFKCLLHLKVQPIVSFHVIYSQPQVINIKCNDHKLTIANTISVQSRVAEVIVELNFLEEVFHSIVASSRCLFETIQGFSKLTNTGFSMTPIAPSETSMYMFILLLLRVVML